MDDDNDDQGLHLDTGSYVEDARDYNPEDPDPDQMDKNLVDEVTNILGGGGSSMNDDDIDDEEDEVEPVDDSEEL